MTLRPATTSDLPEILRWRNDPVTRYFRPDPKIIEPEEHEKWFANLAPDSVLYIYEHGGYPAGQVKYDFGEGEVEVGWIIKPSLRGFGLGKRMVSEALGVITGPRWCQMRWDNTASYSLAVACGFRLTHLIDEMLVLEHD